MTASSAPAPQPEAKAPTTAFGKGFITDAWYFATLSRDVKAAGLDRYELLGEPVLIGRTRAGQVYAMRDICPHRAAPLSAGKLVDHAVVGLMDPAHGPYVHQQWWWRSSHSQHEKAKAFEPREHGFAMVRHAPSSNSYAYKILGGAPATEITFRLPGYRWEHIQVGEKQVLALTCLTPITETKTRITQIFWSDHWVFDLVRPFLKLGARAFLKQDGDMVNLQNEGLRYDPALIWIDDADKQAKWYQQLKREWLKSRAEGRGFSNPVQATTLRWKS